MNEFKVGDIITGNEHSNKEYSITNQNMTRGEVVKVLDDEIEVKYLEGDNDVIGTTFTVDPDFFELVEPSKDFDEEWHSEFLIETCGDKVRFYSYEDEREYIGHFDPDNFTETIVDYIDEVLANRKEGEGINGRYVCASYNGFGYLTVGKIYEFNDGKFVADCGTIFPLNVKIHNEEEMRDYFNGKRGIGDDLLIRFGGDASFVKIVE